MSCFFRRIEPLGPQEACSKQSKTPADPGDIYGTYKTFLPLHANGPLSQHKTSNRPFYCIFFIWLTVPAHKRKYDYTLCRVRISPQYAEPRFAGKYTPCEIYG